MFNKRTAHKINIRYFFVQLQVVCTKIEFLINEEIHASVAQTLFLCGKSRQIAVKNSR